MSSIAEFDCSDGQYLETSKSLLKFVQDTEDKRSASLAQVKDTQQGLIDITRSAKPYRKLADHFAVMYQTCKQLSAVCPQVCVTLDYLRGMLSDMLHQRDNTRFYLSRTSLPAFLLHLEHSSIWKIHKDISPSLFPYQQLLFPFLISLNSSLQKQDKQLPEFLTKPIPYPLLDVLQDKELVATAKQSSVYQTLLSAVSLVSCEPFLNLVNSLKENSFQWKEYLRVSNNQISADTNIK